MDETEKRYSMTKMLEKPREKRPEASEPMHEILDTLCDLMQRVNRHAGKHQGNNMVEKYDYFIRHSSRGRACTYSMKSKQLFQIADWPDIRELLEKLVTSARKIKGMEGWLK